MCWCINGFNSLEDLLQAEVSDLAEIPQLAEQAAAIIEAVKAEAARQHVKGRRNLSCLRL